MPLPQWFVPAVFLVVCIAVTVGAKRLWVRAFAVLFGFLFLQAFLSAFVRDATALTLTFIAAMVLLAGFILRRRYGKKKADKEKDRGGTTVNVYAGKRRR